MRWASSGEGGWNKVLDSVAIFSLVALVRLMEGSEIGAKLVCGGEGELSKACCCAIMASRRAASRAFGDAPPKREVNLLVFVNDGRRGWSLSFFSFIASREGEEEGEVVAKMLRVGMADGRLC